MDSISGKSINDSIGDCVASSSPEEALEEDMEKTRFFKIVLMLFGARIFLCNMHVSN